MITDGNINSYHFHSSNSDLGMKNWEKHDLKAGQEEHFGLAKSLGSERGVLTLLEQLKPFNPSQEDLEEIAKIYAKEGPLKEEKDRLQLAKICAQYFEKMPLYLEHFGIDNKHILEVLEVYVQYHSIWVLMNCIQSSNLDPNSCFHLAQLYLKDPKWVKDILQNIYRFNLPTLELQSLLKNYLVDDPLGIVCFPPSLHWELEDFARQALVTKLLNSDNNYLEENQKKIKKIFSPEDNKFYNFYLSCLKTDFHEEWLGKLQQLSPSHVLFQSCFQEIKQHKNPVSQKHLVLWLSLLMKAHELRLLSDEQVETNQALIKEIQEFPHPSLRGLLSLSLMQVNLPPIEENSFPLLSLALTDLLEKVPHDLLNRRKAFFGDNSKQQIFLQLIYALKREKKLSREDKAKLIQWTLTSSPTDTTRWMQMITNLTMGHFLDSVEKVNSLKKTEELLQNLFYEKFSLTGIPDFLPKYHDTFDKFRDKYAIMTYVTSLEKLPSDEKTQALLLLSLFVQSVLDRSFAKRRYEYESNPHLEKIFQGREELKKEWRRGESISAKDLLEEAEENEKPYDFYEFFKSKIDEEKHLGEDWEKTYPYLRRAFTEKEKIPELLASLEVERKEKIKQLGQVSGQEKKEINIFLRRKNEERLILSLALNTENLQSAKFSLAELKSFLKEKLAFIDDLSSLKTNKKNKEKGEGLTIHDTDEPDDLLSIGAIRKSCQRVDGDPESNKCLLAYLLDGKNRAVVVKDREGKIVARCILRLLIDQKTEKPVLFQEQIYYNLGYETIAAQLINKMCKRRAQKLNLPLLANADEGLKSYPNPIISLGGPSPFEYVDALQDIQKKSSIFTIEKSAILFEPSSS